MHKTNLLSFRYPVETNLLNQVTLIQFSKEE